MKLQRRLKGVADVSRDRQHYGKRRLSPNEAARLASGGDILERLERQNEERRIASTTSPLTARAAGLAYNGPNMPDKGQANGSCNRSACQMPLAGEPVHQFMEGNFTGGPRLHYCATCAADFDDWDHRSGDRIRIRRELKCEAIAGGEA